MELEGVLHHYPMGEGKGAIWILDAEPHVVDMFSRLFRSSYLLNEFELKNRHSFPDYQKFTHRPRALYDGMDTRKDIAWFVKRYDLGINDIALAKIKEGENAYEEFKKKTEEAIKTPIVIPEFNFKTKLREHQIQAGALFRTTKSLLLGDQVGLGKSGSAIGAMAFQDSLPALIVCPTHLCHQWKNEIHKFLGDEVKVEVIEGRTLYELGDAHFYVTAYSRIASWADMFGNKKGQIELKGVVFDEIQELRNSDTAKYNGAKAICETTPYRMGLSATPIMNYGRDIYNIISLLNPNVLGNIDAFIREWCYSGQIRDPKLFGNFLRKRKLMLRRTREEVSLTLNPIEKIVYTVDADMKTLREAEKEAEKLAMTVLTGTFEEAGQASRELSYKLRHATGVAKAKAVSEIVKAIVDSGEKVVLFGWHRDVYEIWCKELSHLNPVLYTGSESPAAKAQSVKAFVEGNSKVFIMSLRSGAGLNDLQFAAKYAVFGELDWSPGVMEQCIGRLWREGQVKNVTAIYITITDGADPYMMEVLGLKNSEAKAIIDPSSKEIGQAYMSDEQRVKDLAKKFLTKRGVAIPLREEIPQSGEAPVLQKVSNEAYIMNLLKDQFLDTSDEKAMQEKIEAILKEKSVNFEREKRLNSKNIIDFYINGLGIECKVSGAGKKDTYRQLLRYIKDAEKDDIDLSAIILVGPWPLKSFYIEDTPIFYLNASKAAIL